MQQVLIHVADIYEILTNLMEWRKKAFESNIFGEKVSPSVVKVYSPIKYQNVADML